MSLNGQLNHTPKSDAALLLFPSFVSNIQQRLERGKRDYGDSSFTRPLAGLISEIQQELEDVSGWSAVIWTQLEAIKKKVECLESLAKEEGYQGLMDKWRDAVKEENGHIRDLKHGQAEVSQSIHQLQSPVGI